MEIRFSAKFQKQYSKTSAKIKKAFDKRLVLFRKDPANPLLRDHRLSGTHRNYKSINITGDRRALYSQEEDTITFEMIGTHSQLYK